MEKILLITTAVLSALALILLAVLVLGLRKLRKGLCDPRDREETKKALEESTRSLRETLQTGRTDLLNELRSVRTETANAVQTSAAHLSAQLREEQKATGEAQVSAITALGTAMENRLKSHADAQTEQNTAQARHLREIGDLLERGMKDQAEAQRTQFGLQDSRQTGLQKAVTDLLSEKITGLTDTVSDRLTEANTAIREYSKQAAEAQEKTAAAVNTQLEAMRSQNAEQLEKMRQTVDEKLQSTLNERITQSFNLVNERLAEVYTGLGEMKNLAGDVGDLKKVLSGVKTRGILGETQLGMLIREILAPGQYEENAVTKPGSRERVEFAVRLPGSGNEDICYLPIDAKFPGDTYARLLEAYDTADRDRIAEARKAVIAVLRSEAKDIRDKYIDPPYTTKFGILFLPFEGLYAEVINMGLSEQLQRDYGVTVAGPTTLSALLNSFQMGFHTLAIQKRSGEIETVLGAVKTEFGKFGETLSAVQKKLNDSSSELERLVGVRTRQINRKLSTVTELSDGETEKYLPSSAEAGIPEETEPC